MKMTRKRSLSPCLLDTSAVIYQQHSHTLQQAAVRDAVAGREAQVPVFVRMEYLRGLILNLIEMWCLIRESVTVQDAFIDWAQKVRQERKLKFVLLTVPQWLALHEDCPSKNRTLNRLGHLVLRLIWSFDEACPRRPDDPLACELGRLDIPRQSYDDDLLLDFHVRFKQVQEGVPDCRLCEFRQAQRKRLGRRKVNLSGPEVRELYKSNAGFVRQAEQAEEAANHTGDSPACRRCEKLGDTIIALQTCRGVAIATADRTFVPLGELLGRKVLLLPSLAELKRQARG
jgi:hypothetical protein